MSNNIANKASDGWPERKDFKRSIRLEISLVLGAVLMMIIVIPGYIIASRYVDSVTFHVVDKQLIRTRSFSSAAGKHLIGTNGPDKLMLSNICTKFASERPDIFWVGIAGSDSTFIAHTNIRSVISSARIRPGGTEGFAELLRQDESMTLVDDSIAITVPIIEGDITVGLLAASSSAQQISEARQVSFISVATIVMLTMLIGLPTTMYVLNRKLRPVTTISLGLRELDFDNLTVDIPVYTRDEFGYLSETLRFMSTKLSESKQKVIESERISRELEIAEQIQHSILPRSYPLLESLEFSGAYSSAKEVGGDYYDFIRFDENRLGFLIADVSGKSLPGMLVMLLTRDLIRNLARTIKDPADLLMAANRELHSHIQTGMFITMAFCVIDQRTGQLTIASAGHDPLVHLDGATGMMTLLKPPGYPLGLLPSGTFDNRIRSIDIPLSENDWIIGYTDGVSEAHNLDNEEFGFDRLLSALQDARSFGAEEMVNSTLKSLNDFVGTASQYDDITLLVMKWKQAQSVKDNQRTKDTVNAV